MFTLSKDIMADLVMQEKKVERKSNVCLLKKVNSIVEQINENSLSERELLIKNITAKITDHVSNELAVTMEKILSMKIKVMEIDGHSLEEIEEKVMELNIDDLSANIYSSFSEIKRELELEILTANAKAAETKAHEAAKAAKEALAKANEDLIKASEQKAKVVSGTTTGKVVPDAEKATRTVVTEDGMKIPPIGSGRTWNPGDQHERHA